MAKLKPNSKLIIVIIVIALGLYWLIKLLIFNYLL